MWLTHFNLLLVISYQESYFYGTHTFFLFYSGPRTLDFSTKNNVSVFLRNWTITGMLIFLCILTVTESFIPTIKSMNSYMLVYLYQWKINSFSICSSYLILTVMNDTLANLNIFILIFMLRIPEVYYLDLATFVFHIFNARTVLLVAWILCVSACYLF